MPCEALDRPGPTGPSKCSGTQAGAHTICFGIWLCVCVQWDISPSQIANQNINEKPLFISLLRPSPSSCPRALSLSRVTVGLSATLPASITTDERLAVRLNPLRRALVQDNAGPAVAFSMRSHRGRWSPCEARYRGSAHLAFLRVTSF
jgi:hypothetical protein